MPISTLETVKYWSKAADIYEELGKRVKSADLHIDVGETLLRVSKRFYR